MPRAKPGSFIPKAPGGKMPAATYAVYVDNERVFDNKSRIACVQHAIRMLKERAEAKSVFYSIEYPVQSYRDRILMSWKKVDGVWRAGAVAA